MQVKIIRVLKILAALFLLLCLPYFNVFIYDFPEPVPFSGSQLYNPYKNLQGYWVKANFHAHSRAFFGLTNGENTPEELLHKYDSLGYDLPSISNYNSVSAANETSPLFVPVYEHGINFFKTHQLVFGQEKAMLFDYPLFQFTSHKQHILNWLRHNNGLLAIAHPSFQKSYSLADMKKLSGYDCMEVLSPRALSPEYWDAALSAGNPVWIVSNDDCHSLEKQGWYGVCWTMLNIREQTSKALMDALRTGKGYGVKGWVGENFNQVKQVTTNGVQVQIEMEHQADSILLRTDGGKLAKKLENTSTAEYTLNPSETYVRAEIWNRGYTRIFLNPLVRSEDGSLPKEKKTPTKNWLLSILYWLALAATYFIALKWIVKSR